MTAPNATADKVRSRLLDTDADNPLLVTQTTLEEGIGSAVGRYSHDRPRLVVADLAGAGSSYFVLVGTGAVLSAWSDGFSRIRWIEYPAQTVSGSYSPLYLDEDDDWTYAQDASKKYLRLRAAAPSASETVRIAYTAPHSHNQTTDTIPTQDLDAVCDLAAALCCRALATRAAGSTDAMVTADAVNYRDSQLRYRQMADAWEASYRERIAQGGDPLDGGRVGAGANADWDRRLSFGWPFLTHGPRLR